MVGTPQVEFDRLAERLAEKYSIIDEETFNEAFNDYLEDENRARNNSALREKVFGVITDKDKNINKGSIHKQAGGKSFERDRQHTAKTVLPEGDIKEYKKRGASNVDMKNYDTKKAFTRKGFIKDRVVLGREVKVKLGKVIITRFRDKRGRFIKTL